MSSNKQKIVRILKQLEIPYWTEGKNVSEDSVNIQCPFCNDPSNHCGIFEDTLLYSCWRCRESGPLKKLLHHLTGYSEKQCEDIIEESSLSFKENTLNQIEDITNPQLNQKKKEPEITRIFLPKYAKLIVYNTRTKLLNSYLKRRGIKLSTLIKHKCSICEVGYYMNRLIIPVYYKGILVSYQAADLTGRAKLKYNTAPGTINNYLYGIDDTNKKVILVEGILDAWRIGKGTCATFGTHITKQQEKLILSKNFEELIFCWDRDAYWKAKKQAKLFELDISKIKIITLPLNEDPDSFGRKYGKNSLLDLIEKS